MMKNNFIKATVIAVSLAMAVPAFAQVNVGTSVDVSGSAGVNPGGPMIRVGANASTTAGERGRMSSTTVEERIQTRVQNGQNRGDQAVTARIDALNKLISRIGSMKNLSDSEKASFTAEIQSEVSSMTSLEAKIQSDTSTTSLRADLQTIAPDYRIYMLIEPQISLLSAVDRVNTLVSDLQTIQSKIQARVSADASLSGNATIASDTADMTAKLSDASSQAASAQAEISGLQPDNGNQTVMQSNISALKDARTKIQAAQKDLVAARQDAGAMVKIIIRSDASLGVSASTTGN